MPQDTRKDPRAKVLSLNVRYKSATVDEFIEHHSHDISKGGIFIKTPSPFPAGTLLKFEIRIKEDQSIIAGVGRVVWKREPPQASSEKPAGMGVKFIKLDGQSRELIERIVAARKTEGLVFEDTPDGKAPSNLPPAPIGWVSRASTKLASAAPHPDAAPPMPAPHGQAGTAPGRSNAPGPMPSAGANTASTGTAVRGAAQGGGQVPAFPPSSFNPPGGLPNAFFPEGSPYDEMPPANERTVIRQADEILADALRGAGMASASAPPIPPIEPPPALTREEAAKAERRAVMRKSTLLGMPTVPDFSGFNEARREGPISDVPPVARASARHDSEPAAHPLRQSTGLSSGSPRMDRPQGGSVPPEAGHADSSRVGASAGSPLAMEGTSAPQAHGASPSGAPTAMGAGSSVAPSGPRTLMGVSASAPPIGAESNTTVNAPVIPPPEMSAYAPTADEPSLQGPPPANTSTSAGPLPMVPMVEAEAKAALTPAPLPVRPTAPLTPPTGAIRSRVSERPPAPEPPSAAAKSKVTATGKGPGRVSVSGEQVPPVTHRNGAPKSTLGWWALVAVLAGIAAGGGFYLASRGDWGAPPAISEPVPAPPPVVVQPPPTVVTPEPSVSASVAAAQIEALAVNSEAGVDAASPADAARDGASDGGAMDAARDTSTSPASASASASPSVSARPTPPPPAPVVHRPPTPRPTPRPAPPTPGQPPPKDLPSEYE